MTAKIKEDLIECLQSLQGVSPNNKPELNKVISTLERPDVRIPDDRENKQKVSYFLGLLFTHMPELIQPANEKPLNFFSTKAKLLPETISKKPIKGG